MLIFVKDKTGRHALLFALLFALLHGLLSAPFGGDLLNWVTLVPATVAEAVLILHAGPLAILLPPVLSTAVALLTGVSLPAALFSLCYFACALVLAFVMRHRIERVHAIAFLATTCLLFFAGRAVWELALSAADAGAADLMTYLRDTLAEVQDNFVVAYRDLYNNLRESYAGKGLELIEFPEAAMREAVARVFSLLPAVLAVLFCILAILMTYGMQFVSFMRGNQKAFAGTTWPFRIGPVTAVLYILLIPVALFWGDFGSAVFVALFNLFFLLTPILAFFEVLNLPAFFSAYRKAVGGAAIIFPILMTVSLFLAFPDYTCIGFALLYAVRTLKLAYASRAPRAEE